MSASRSLTPNSRLDGEHQVDEVEGVRSEIVDQSRFERDPSFKRVNPPPYVPIQRLPSRAVRRARYLPLEPESAIVIPGGGNACSVRNTKRGLPNDLAFAAE